MSHFVTGFIIKTNFVHLVRSKYSYLHAVSLEQGFSLFPLTDKLIETLSSNSRDTRELNNLPNDLTDLLAKLSFVGPLLYFETEYFGGAGNQSAVVFENGKIIFGPTQGAIGPINKGLRWLGVITDSTSDEFDTLRLGEHRSAEDWLEHGE